LCGLDVGGEVVELVWFGRCVREKYEAGVCVGERDGGAEFVWFERCAVR
jgi:hypothetical protein